MKKLIVAFLCVVAVSAHAQVYEGLNMHGGMAKRSFSMLSNQDSKNLTDDLQSYLGKFGKVSKPERNIYRIQNLKGNVISSDLSYIDVISKGNKTAEKLEFFFLNNANNALNNFEMNKIDAEDFVQAFVDFTQKQLEAKLLTANVSMAEDALKDAQKEKNKLEKSIANNLKEQQKLGKKLDASPEQMAQILAEKEEIVSQLYSNDTTEITNEKEQASLNKASQKKDREITKLQRDKKKNESKLDKKEAELVELKAALEASKINVKNLEKVLSDTKSLVQKLK